MVGIVSFPDPNQGVATRRWNLIAPRVRRILEHYSGEADSGL
jgi:hypothetical protein